MRPFGRAWGNPMSERKLYLLGPESFEMKTLYELNAAGRRIKKYAHIESDRVGICWAQGRLKPGDIVLCDKLSGDCFYDFYLVDYEIFANREGIQMRLVPYRFGAYAMKATELEGMTERDYHLLRAGERVNVMTRLP